MLGRLPTDDKVQAVRFLGDCFEGKIRTLRLLFCASKHEFSAAEFHRLCDVIPDTLVLVRSEKGKTFGGYTPLPWRSPEEEFYEQECSFDESGEYE